VVSDGKLGNKAEWVLIFLFWTVSFTDEIDQTYLAIVHLQGNPCEEHGWVYSRGGTTCVDPDE